MQSMRLRLLHTDKLRDGRRCVAFAAMSYVRLLSTDFDGTLIGHPSDGRCSLSFASALREHHRAGGLWAVNTGRGLEHTLEGLAIFAAPVEPDFLLCHERELYHRVDGEWKPYADWNALCRQRHAELFRSTASLFAVIEQMAGKSDNHITMLYEGEVPAGLVTSSEGVMEKVTLELEREMQQHPGFGYQRNTIYLRFCHRDYHKGSTLGELCRLENIPREDVFAAGDHYNDISMLDGTHAGMTACPANAIDLVKDVVRRANGYVAENLWADGVAEALNHYRAMGPKRDGVCV